jgi:hypothetical protein
LLDRISNDNKSVMSLSSTIPSAISFATAASSTTSAVAAAVEDAQTSSIKDKNELEGSGHSNGVMSNDDTKAKRNAHLSQLYDEVGIPFHFILLRLPTLIQHSPICSFYSIHQ